MLKIILIILGVLVFLPILIYGIGLLIVAIGLSKINFRPSKAKQQSKRSEIYYERYKVTELFSVEKYFEKKKSLEIIDEKFMYTTLWGSEPLECVQVTYWVTERRKRS